MRFLLVCSNQTELFGTLCCIFIFIITLLQRPPVTDSNQKSLVYIKIMNMNYVLHEVNESDLVNDVQF